MPLLLIVNNGDVLGIFNSVSLVINPIADIVDVVDILPVESIKAYVVTPEFSGPLLT